MTKSLFMDKIDSDNDFILKVIKISENKDYSDNSAMVKIREIIKEYKKKVYARIDTNSM